METRGAKPKRPELWGDLASAELLDVLKVDYMTPNIARCAIRRAPIAGKYFKTFGYGGYTYYVRVK